MNYFLNKIFVNKREYHKMQHPINTEKENIGSSICCLQLLQNCKRKRYVSSWCICTCKKYSLFNKNANTYCDSCYSNNYFPALYRKAINCENLWKLLVCSALLTLFVSDFFFPQDMHFCCTSYDQSWAIWEVISSAERDRGDVVRSRKQHIQKTNTGFIFPYFSQNNDCGADPA